LFNNKLITFIGPGVMAEAMIGGIIRDGVALGEAIRVAGPRPRRGEFLAQKYGLATYADNAAAAREADVVILSIKPQSLDAVLAELRGQVKPDALVLSIIAGAPISKIAAGLRHKLVVRSMPNTPARIGKGITVWTAAAEVMEEQKGMAQKILGALGQDVYMGDEKFLDMATALSGTGPAYVFLFMEAMVDAGVHLGFPRRVAEQLVIETVRGSAEYYVNAAESQPLHLAGLRNQVTSPGGTTAAALYFLEKAGFRTAISRAIWAAYERSRELGKDAEAHAPQETG
jgi:pyrroline-5-carboxylate reductase